MKQFDLLLLGGGHTHVLVLKALAAKPIPGVRVTLVSQTRLTPYSGMLPGYIAGHYDELETQIDLSQLAKKSRATFICATASSIDTRKEKVILEDRPAIAYDALSIDIGSTPDLSVTGAREFAIGVKPIAKFHKRWQNLFAASNTSAEGGQTVADAQQWAVIGAGAGGFELAMAMAHRTRDRAEHKIKLVFATDSVLPGYPAKVQQLAQQALKKLGVDLHSGFRVNEVREGALIAETHDIIEVSQSIWCTGAEGAHWLAASGLPVNERGFVHVNEFLQVIDHENIFAVGDCAHMLDSPRPKAGVYAVRQAPFLSENLRRFCVAKTSATTAALKTCKLQDGFLSLLSLGDKQAIASRNGFSAAGGWAWRWKDYIDRRFMRQFLDLPLPKNMASERPEDELMHCKGCASKIGPAALGQSLAAIAEHPAASINWEDAVVWRPQPKTHRLQSVDGFRAFISDYYLFARIALEHAFNDIYAMGGEVVHAQLWANVEFLSADLQQRDLAFLLNGAADACSQAHAKLVGGHSSEGPEAHLGVLVDGVLTGGTHWAKSPPAAGDYLLITKPLGTGVILAADEQAKAPATVLDAALASMLQSNRGFMQALSHLEPSAVTDVSGFGLLGHLLEMLGDSELSATLFVDRIPLLPGALELSEAGVQSSLTAQLENSLQACGGPAIQRPETRLLLDPQTSGGLLCAIEEQAAKWLLDHFPQTTIVGRVEAKSRDKKLHLVVSSEKKT